MAANDSFEGRVTQCPPGYALGFDSWKNYYDWIPCRRLGTRVLPAIDYPELAMIHGIGDFRDFRRLLFDTPARKLWKEAYRETRRHMPAENRPDGRHSRPRAFRQPAREIVWHTPMTVSLDRVTT